MSLEVRLATSLGIALGLVYLATPVAIRVADRFEFYDRPAGYKGHANPTPYLGGVALVVGYILALLALTGDWERTLPLVGGVGLLCLIGTVDDRRNISPLIRVTAEVGVAVTLWALGLGWELGAGPVFDVAVTAFWIVAVVNAFNLFDNMDGAASSMGGVVAAGLAIFGIVGGDAWLAVAAAALAGACLGFLPHNLLRSPARIFLGDGGSMPVGFAVAALAMIGLTDAAAEWQSLAMGLLFVGIPALDTCLVIVSRTRRGVPILTAGRDHLTHRAHRRLRNAKAVAVALGGAQAIVSVLAVIALESGSAAIVPTVAGYVAALGVAIALLDTRLLPESEHGPAHGPPSPSGPPPRRRLSLEVAAPALLVPFGLAAGVSPLGSGYYSSGVWVPAGLVLVTVTTALVIARPVRLTGPAVLALSAIAGLAIWSLASAAWGDSIQQAVVEGNRFLVYAVGLGCLLLVIRTERAAAWLVAAVAGGALAVAGVVAVRMLGSDGPSLFLGGRLDEPLGYINGQASLFLVGLWASMAAVEQRRSALLAGVGAAATTLLGSLLVLSQSRGVALAAAVSLVLVLVLVPGRVRRSWSVVAIGGGLTLAFPPLLDVYGSADGGAVPDQVVRDAARAALLAAAATGLFWGIAAHVSAAKPLPAARRLASAGIVVLLATGTVVAAVNADRISDDLHRQYSAFVHLAAEPAGSGAESRSRLVSGAGNRYDYWRIAWGAFKDRPLLGWGAGNYDGPYFLRRATAEDIRQPHSIQLQTLSELGLVGGALLLLLLAATAWGAWRAARATGRDPALGGVAAAGIGMISAWWVHTSVDWIHLLPGVTAAAFAGLAILVRQPGSKVRPPGGAARFVPRSGAAVAVTVVLAVTGLSLTRQGMAEHFLTRAQALLAEDPARALANADRALRLDPEHVSAYYVKAAALARFNELAASRAALQRAARQEPRDFVTWALLGDLSVRAGDLDRARREYGRASRLNPQDPSLRASARDPSRAAP